MRPDAMIGLALADEFKLCALRVHRLAERQFDDEPKVGNF
jgi:hypothetical protein